MKYISLLGASGSIGTQSLDVIENHPEQFRLVAFSVGLNIDLARKAINTFKPELVATLRKEDCETLQTEYPSITCTYGEKGLIEVATYEKSTILLNAVMGRVGLEPTLQAIEAKKTIALANKETLVTAGHLVMQKAKEHGVNILPVDSEHSAIYQCLNGEDEKSITSLILTASGGSFRDYSRDQLQEVTVEQALNHPNWSMGAKITIDSATMMNKGLEVIEAHWLFSIPYEQINVLLHRESIIHSMVEYDDTSVIAQLGTPNMRVPIQYALTYPQRLPIKQSERLNLAQISQLHFKQVDFDRFRCLALAYEAGKAGGSVPTVLNAANEAAVEAFLAEKITFLQIEELIEKAIASHKKIDNPDLQMIQEIDLQTRKYVQSLF